MRTEWGMLARPLYCNVVISTSESFPRIMGSSASMKPFSCRKCLPDSASYTTFWSGRLIRSLIDGFSVCADLVLGLIGLMGEFGLAVNLALDSQLGGAMVVLGEVE